jgi:opacity protein-like surface antigen
MNRQKSVWMALVAVVVLAAGWVSAGEAPGWSFKVAPYAWLTRMNGDVEVKGHEVPVDIGFDDSIDMLKDLKGVLMLHGEASKGDLSCLGDIYIIALSHKGNTPAGEADVHFDQLIGELGAAYALPVNSGGVVLEALGGARAESVRSEIEIGGIGVDADETKTWVDPFVGFRIKMPIGEKVMISLRGDVGGFGMGSDFAWNAVGTAEWAITDRWSAGLAYRCLDVDFDDSDFEYDVRMDGPALGVGYKF